MHDSPSQNAPFVTIILPIRNEERHIERTLNAVIAQDYSGKMEILIADGMSTDNTREINSHIVHSHHANR